MNKNILILSIVIVLIGGPIVLYAVSRSSEETQLANQTSMMSNQDNIAESNSSELQNENLSNNTSPSIELSDNISGEYLAYDSSLLTDEVNVIFFAASWCPTCRSLDRSINSELSSIPSDLTILKADYDSELELRRKYGVTYQHTLVQVDKDGNQLKKWNGSQDIAEIVSQII